MDVFMLLGDPLGNFSPHAPSRWPIMGCLVVARPPWVGLGTWSAPCSCRSTNWIFFDQPSVFLVHNTHTIHKVIRKLSHRASTKNSRFISDDPKFHLFINFDVDGLCFGCGPQRKCGRHYGVCMYSFTILKDLPSWNWIQTTSIGSSSTISQALGNWWKGEIWGHL